MYETIHLLKSKAPHLFAYVPLCVFGTGDIRKYILTNLLSLPCFDIPNLIGIQMGVHTWQVLLSYNNLFVLIALII